MARLRDLTVYTVWSFATERDARFEPGTTDSAVWSTTNEQGWEFALSLFAQNRPFLKNDSEGFALIAL